MKTAVFIKDGVTQIVLTPETPLETSVLDIVEQKAWPSNEKRYHSGTLYRGSFYACQGGWYREGETEDSLIIRVEKELPVKDAANA